MIHSLFIFLLVVFSFLATLTVSFSSSDDASSALNCSSSSTCGGVDISYPFWRSDSPPPSSSAVHCGYPGFGITCNDDMPILQIGSGHYYKATGIDYSSRTINLTDMDVDDVPPGPNPDDLIGSCPRVRYNLTFSKELAYTSEDANLTFFFNCSDDGLLPDLPQEHNIPCLGYDRKSSFVFPGDEVPPEIWMSACEDVVVAPVLHDFLWDPAHDFSKALNYGFQLTWIAGAPEWCEECEGSGGGRCGFNLTSRSPLCFCPDGTTAGYCPGM